jgi:hypothetical protein
MGIVLLDAITAFELAEFCITSIINRVSSVGVVARYELDDWVFSSGIGRGLWLHVQISLL